MAEVGSFINSPIDNLASTDEFEGIEILGEVIDLLRLNLISTSPSDD